MQAIFQRIESMQDREFLLRVSYMEVRARCRNALLRVSMLTRLDRRPSTDMAAFCLEYSNFLTPAHPEHLLIDAVGPCTLMQPPSLSHQCQCRCTTRR